MPFYVILIDGVVLLAFLYFLYRRHALKNVHYSRRFSKDAVFEGEQIEMVEEIENRKLLPVPWLRLESHLSRSLQFERQANLAIRSGEMFQNHLSLFSLKPYRRIVRRHRIICAKRGFYTQDTATMTAGEPLGLVQVSSQLQLKLSHVLVYPRIVPLREVPLPNHSWLGDITVRRWIAEDPFLAAGVREYAPGDPLSGVSWKATARTGKLQTFRKDHTADHRLVICLNVEIDSAMWKTVTEPERIEAGIRYAATLADYAIRSGMETGLVSNGRLIGEPKQPVRIEPAGGTIHAESLLACLAKLQLETASNMAYLLEQEAGFVRARTDYLIITCHREEKLAEAAEKLRRLGNGVEWLDIPEQVKEGQQTAQAGGYENDRET